MLDSTFYDTLSRLRLRMSHKSSGSLSGNRKSLKKGSSTEFSGFREYQPGDDIRRIDWNAYGRLDKLFIKEYMEEKESVITILIDTSASMDYGNPQKSRLALQLAEALSYIGLSGMDRVQLYDTCRMQSPLLASGGKRSLPKLNAWLEQREFTGQANLYEAVRMLPARGQGVTILISDFLEEEMLVPAPGGKSPDALDKLLRLLNYRRQQAVLLQVLAQEELDVTLTGALNLIDMELEDKLRLTMDDAAIRAYEKELDGFISKLRSACARTGSVYALCSTAANLHKLIFQDLRMIYEQ